MDFYKFDLVEKYLPFFIKGTWVTIEISVASIIFGTLLGLFIALGKMSSVQVIRQPFIWYINFFRGTPLLVQLFLIHFAVMPLFMKPPIALVSAITALSLNAAAYIAEIFRAGIQSIDKGQTEAARSLGMTHRQTMRHIIIPQASKRMIPPLGNEFIVLIKDSSLAAVIATEELMYWGRAMMGEYYRPWEPFLTVALIYLILTLTLTQLLNFLERKYALD
ncbi:amino acid ABC transporter permease [Fictibacillus sp. WQ 8-8]|uniref:Amino acid ABC transporter permease n=1 Tax=Fictibacillus marinisediminis TaxID=2878389 RepID=A0A9X1XEF1_9BACL|nr:MULTISPECIES: amino acid ABC transporter permease [Fictibacillus]MCK6258008.1 amino acid ABC transporter permease [Fictibacillus marinisediminis]MCQ6266530.1 amino acid ABC transporter permease [Fictibacillus sp. WQ 8-8]MED2971537.1 amino acid ABC transporter permease [Fictibacillus sp. B-59209]SFD59827.1 amino acid ABC transporter membrane protein, PAAT family [Bacillus sp. OV194]